MKKIFFFFTSFFFAHLLQAQADFIELGSPQYHFIERMEMRLRKDSVLNFSTIKPFDRKVITQRLEYIDSLQKTGTLKLSRVDKYIWK